MGTVDAAYKGLPIADLISAPLSAAADAQIRLANNTAEFIRMIGFEPPTAAQLSADPNSVGLPRIADFVFTRPVPLLPATDPPTMTTETVEIKLPLIMAVDIPALSIESVDIIFDMEVKSAISAKSTKDEALSASLDASGKWGAIKVAVHVQASMAAHQENTSSTDTSAKYHIEVHAKRAPPSEGLRRVLDIMNSAIVPVKA